MSARRLDLAVAGASGRVGRAFVALLGTRQAALREGGVELRLVGAARSGAWRWDGRGLAAAPDALLAGAEPGRAGAFLALARAHASAPGAAPLALVDCTASEPLAEASPGLLAAGVAVVSANKRGGAGPLARWRALHERTGAAPWRQSATVGAGMPVLATVRRLRRRGERVRGVRAVLSGSLSAVLGAVQDGAAFSEAVADARARGCTEPHPGDDLSGEDVARKLLLVLREAGVALERPDVRVEPLVPAALLDARDPDAFCAALPALDAAWRRRAEDAWGAGRRLVFVAEWDGARARAEVRALPEDDALAALRPGENRVELVTDVHADVPLAISGPGAGPAVTAANVLSDVLDVARGPWAARPAAHGLQPASLASFVARAV